MYLFFLAKMITICVFRLNKIIAYNLKRIRPIILAENEHSKTLVSSVTKDAVDVYYFDKNLVFSWWLNPGIPRSTPCKK